MIGYQNEAVTLIELPLEIYLENGKTDFFLAYPLKTC